MPKPEKILISVRITRKTKDILEQFCNESIIYNQSNFVEMAILEKLNREKSEK